MNMNNLTASVFNKLRLRLTLPLPGENAQFKMAPQNRLAMHEYHDLASRNPHRSAVLICLFPGEHYISTLLMLRPDEKGAHSGQISFPGGKYEEQDADLQATALRESREEVGIEPETVTVLGAMTPLYIPVSNYLVQPFLATLEVKPDWKRNDQEVKQIIETDLRLLRDHSLKHQGIFSGWKGMQINAPYYNLYGHKVWGATAMMLSELEHLLQDTAL